MSSSTTTRGGSNGIADAVGSRGNIGVAAAAAACRFAANKFVTWEIEKSGGPGWATRPELITDGRMGKPKRWGGRRCPQPSSLDGGPHHFIVAAIAVVAATAKR